MEAQPAPHPHHMLTDLDEQIRTYPTQPPLGKAGTRLDAAVVSSHTRGAQIGLLIENVRLGPLPLLFAKPPLEDFEAASQNGSRVDELHCGEDAPLSRLIARLLDEQWSTSRLADLFTLVQLLAVYCQHSAHLLSEVSLRLTPTQLSCVRWCDDALSSWRAAAALHPKMEKSG